ncbi:MAG TPA: mechanosensitive ion channel family protein [Burkholderiales bacterium]|nr:mechanosensitive ion channel family protein [Burkholderiales bacterium]
MKWLTEAWRTNSLYDWAMAGLVLVGAMVGLWLVRYVASRVIAAVAKRTVTELDDHIAQVATRTKLWLLFPIAIYAAASALELPEKIERLIEFLVVVGLLLQIVLWINDLISFWIGRQVEKRRGVDGEGVTALTLLGFTARVVVWVLMLLLILDQVGFDITALVAGLGIGGVAIALAVQNILGDLFASLSIVLDKPFVVGDFIIVDDYLGTVEYIGLKTTRVRSLGGEMIIFSNNDLLKSRIRNYKRMYERRIVFTVQVSYDTPAEKLEAIPGILRAAVEGRKQTRFDRAHLKEFAGSALYEVVYFMLTADYNVYMDTQQAINLEVYRRFDEERIEFAYPTRTVYVRGSQAPAAASASG